jgi:hypothetical protein
VGLSGTQREGYTITCNVKGLNVGDIIDCSCGNWWWCLLDLGLNKDKRTPLRSSLLNRRL